MLTRLRRRLLRILPERSVSWLRALRLAKARRQAMTAVNSPPAGPGRRHGLPGELVISLTSYPARYASLDLTIRSLQRQSVAPDRIVLWIASGDLPSLPDRVSALQSDGLEIRTCEDLKSYKKLVPALLAFPAAYIVTADDDLYFPAHWLGALVEGAGDAREIRAWRAHRMVADDRGKIKPYLHWDLDVQDAGARQPSSDLIPTSGSGALFPPNSLHPGVTERAKFERICPNGDDLWFAWCARRAGTQVVKVGDKFRLVTWPGSQDESLWEDNRQGGNDRMIRALEAEFGLLP